MLKPSSTSRAANSGSWRLSVIVHGDEHVAAGRQAAFVCGELALGERVREVAVEAHDLAGGTHFRSEQHVDGLAERSAESLERKHGFLDGHLLATMDVATVAVGQEQAVVTLLLDGFAGHNAGRGLGQCTPVALDANGTVREARGLASITYSVLAMKAYCTLIRPCTPQPLAMRRCLHADDGSGHRTACSEAGCRRRHRNGRQLPRRAP